MHLDIRYPRSIRSVITLDIILHNSCQPSTPFKTKKNSPEDPIFNPLCTKGWWQNKTWIIQFGDYWLSSESIHIIKWIKRFEINYYFILVKSKINNIKKREKKQIWHSFGKYSTFWDIFGTFISSCMKINNIKMPNYHLNIYIS